MVEVRIGGRAIEFLSYEEFEDRVRAGRIPADAEVRFEPVTGTEFAVAGELDLVKSLASDKTVAWRARFSNSGPPLLTALIVGVQIRIWMFTGVPETGTDFTYNGLNWLPPALEDGESWRVMTHGLLHTDFLHILLNNVWLAYTGWNIERALGRANLAAIFFFSVFCGGILSIFLTPSVPSLGASGGVYGLVSASVVFGFVRQDLLPERGRQLFGVALLPYLVLMFFSGLSNPSTDNWAHFGGLVCGGVMAFLVDPPGFQRRVYQNRLVHGVGTGVIVVTLLAMGLLGPRLYPLIDEEAARLAALPSAARAKTFQDQALLLDELEWHVPSGWKPGANPAGDTAFRSPAADRRRSFAVVQTEHNRPLSADALAEDWKQGLLRGNPDAEVEEGTPGPWLGRPAENVRRLEVRLPGEAEGQPVLLSFIVASQGTWSLHQVWEREVHSDSRLAPLAARMAASVKWLEPLALQGARRTLEGTPRSVRGRRELAWELARWGQAEEAVALQQKLVEERPLEPEGWITLLTMASWYPEALDVPALRDRALSDVRDPSIVVAVAQGLRDAGDSEAADGVLGLAFVKTPGDRKLRKALRAAGLPWELDAKGLPTTLSVLPDGSPRRGEQIAYWQTQGLSVAAGRAWAQLARTEREAIGQSVVARLASPEPVSSATVAALMRLRDGTTDLFPGDEKVLVRDLSALLGDRPPVWMPDAVATALKPHAEALIERVNPSE